MGSEYSSSPLDGAAERSLRAHINGEGGLGDLDLFILGEGTEQNDSWSWQALTGMNLRS